jgi:trehalose/maltose hydrolase-like predicted phosphorylase
MNDGLLTTQYSWVDGDRTTAVSVCTFLSEQSTHFAATRITLAPDFTGLITLHFNLRPYATPAHRLQLARLTGPEIDKSLRIPAGSGMKKSSPTASDRAAIWYPGEVRITSYGGNERDRLLWIGGRAVNGAAVTETAAVKLPEGLAPKTVKVKASADLVDLEISAIVEKGKSYSFTKFIGVAREGWDQESATARAKEARAEDFPAILAHHKAAWHNLWQSDVVVDGDAQLQKAIHSDLFYLLENSTPDTDIPMLACGLTPNYYSHVFWDNDNWDFPVMLLLHPDRAKSLVMFRYRTLAAAEARARKEGFKGAMFPWESDPVTGAEVTPYFVKQFAVREVHVNGDVAIAQWQYYLATSDKEWLRSYGYPVLRDVAEFWKSRVTFNRDKNRYEILHVTSTDEAYDDVANDTFTNAVAQKALRIASQAARALGLAPDPEWDRISNQMYIPFSEKLNRHLVFDESIPHDLKTWGVSNIAMLALPSLDLSMPEEVRHNDFSFAAENINKLTTDANQNGLFVTMLPIEAATLGLPRDSSEWVARSTGGFLKPPFNVRSETAENNTLYILAVSGGFLQDFVYGFSGLRFADEGLVPTYAPVLPASLKSITLRGIQVSNRTYDFQITQDASGKVHLRKVPVL